MTSAQRDTQNIHVSPLIEAKRASGFNSGEISGYASVWGGPPDSYGTRFAKGAFAASLAEHAREGTAPIMLWAHNKAELIGKWSTLREDDHGLYVEGRLNLETTRGREAFSHLKAGDLSGLSIGVYIDPTSLTRNRDGSTTIGKVDLFEVSVVGVPSNKQARIKQVRSLQSKAELFELLREGGLAKSAAQRVAAAGWPVLSGADETRARALMAQISAKTQLIRNMK